MYRDRFIMRGIDAKHHGIEIAPWLCPLAPKRKGYKCITLDVFDTETLLSRAKADPNIDNARLPEIETVDLVGNAIDIAEIVGQKYQVGTFDYVVSSHNFEHLPDPIKFLRGCQTVLKRDGIVSMALPDHRACFDYFRPTTLVNEWLVAYHEGRRKPTPSQVFATHAYCSRLRKADGSAEQTFSIDDEADDIEVVGDLRSAYVTFTRALEATPAEYVDAHCTVMSPRSFELLLTECRQLELFTFKILEISSFNVCEFYVRLQSGTTADCGPLPVAEFQLLRNRLLHQIHEEHMDRYVPRTALAAKMNRMRIITRKIRLDPVGAGNAIFRRMMRR